MAMLVVRASQSKLGVGADTQATGTARKSAARVQAARFPRTHAARLGIAPDRIGMMISSAGAITTVSVAKDNDPASRTHLAASIHGAGDDAPPPGDAPPLLVAAQNDTNVPVTRSPMMVSDAANLPADVHVYERGGHGFGPRQHESTLNGWPAAFELGPKVRGSIGDVPVSRIALVRT